MIVDGANGDGTICGAQVLSVGEVMRVSVKQINVEGIALGYCDLRLDRVRFEINPQRHTQMLVAQYRRAGEVNNGVGALEELTKLRLRKTEKSALGVNGAIGPAIRQTTPGHEPADVMESVGAVIAASILLGIVRPFAAILDVVTVEARAAKARGVVHRVASPAGSRRA